MSEPVINNQNLTVPAMAGAVALSVLFGANAVAIKICLTGVGPLTTAGLRFTIAAVTLVLWARITGQKIAVPRSDLYKLLIVSAIFTVQLGIFYTGINLTNASRATLIANLMPFFILVLAHFFIPGDSITRRKLIGMILGFTGMTLIFLDSKNTTAGLRVGDLIVLSAAFIWACGTVYTKRIIDAFSPLQISIYPMFLSGPIYIVLGGLVDEAMIFDLNSQVVASLVYQSVVTASFGFITWNSLLKKYGATALHSFVFIMPISGVVLGGLMLGEPITGNLISSMFLVAVGILIVHLRSIKPPHILKNSKKITPDS